MTTVAGLILISALWKTKKLVTVLKTHLIEDEIILLFPFEFILEFKFALLGGYLGVDASYDFKAGLRASVEALLKAFPRMHVLFIIPAVLIVVISLIVFLRSRFLKKISDSDRKRFNTCLLFLIAAIVLWVFFTLFGALNLGHIYTRELFRMDTLSCGFFMVLAFFAICLSVLLDKCKLSVEVYPLMIGIMMYAVLSPKYSLRDSVYCDNVYFSPQQQYKIMSAIVEQVQENDRQGKTHTIVHMTPDYGTSIIDTMYYHGLICRPCTIEFIYDGTVDNTYFE